MTCFNVSVTVSSRVCTALMLSLFSCVSFARPSSCFMISSRDLSILTHLQFRQLRLDLCQHRICSHPGSLDLGLVTLHPLPQLFDFQKLGLNCCLHLGRFLRSRFCGKSVFHGSCLPIEVGRKSLHPILLYGIL